MLKEKRRQAILLATEMRIRTEAEREEHAKQKLREELVSLAEVGNVDGIRGLLLQIASEAETTSTKPRVTAECRNSQGQSLLSIAAQRNDVSLAEFLLTHWKSCDKDR